MTAHANQVSFKSYLHVDAALSEFTTQNTKSSVNTYEILGAIYLIGYLKSLRIVTQPYLEFDV